MDESWHGHDRTCSFLNMCPTVRLLQLVNLFTTSFVANGSSWRWVLATELGSCFWRIGRCCSVFAVVWLWLVLDCCWGVALLDLALLLNTRGNTCGFTSCGGSCFCCLDDFGADSDFWARGSFGWLIVLGFLLVVGLGFFFDGFFGLLARFCSWSNACCLILCQTLSLINFHNLICSSASANSCSLITKFLCSDVFSSNFSNRKKLKYWMKFSYQGWHQLS